MQRLALALAALVLVVPAAAHNEADAVLLRPDVVAAGHDPAAVQPHTQWSGWLQLAPGSNVTAASYQICRVGSACFAPPAPATRDGDVFRFNTTAYLANGQPIDFQPGWRIGVQWVLTEGSGPAARAVLFPEGLSATDASCQGAAALACQESHYLAFSLPAALSTPGVGLAMVLAFVAAAATRRRRHG